MLASALVDGLSLEGAGEALSIGAAGLFLRSLTGNPMDVHLHTSVNLRRYLLQLDGLSQRNKLMALLLWHTGPEVRSTQRRMQPGPQPDPAAVAALPYRTQEELLDALAESIYQQPPIDWATVTNLGQVRAVPEVREGTAVIRTGRLDTIPTGTRVAEPETHRPRQGPCRRWTQRCRDSPKATG
jgi:hypothetical protein